MAHRNYKLPQVTAGFWVLKIAATTLGETGGDLLAQTLHLGYAAASALFLTIFGVALCTQLRVRQFHPGLYWTVIGATSTAGTTISDLLNRGPGSGTSTDGGLGYGAGAAILIAGLAIVFVIWKLSGQTYDVSAITGLRGEILYWSAILLSNTLGTSVGDYLSDSSGLGYWAGATLIAAVMMAILAMRYLTNMSGVLLFWVAFVLTRPLGATVGDLLSKPHANGGLGFGTLGTSAALLVVLIVGVGIHHAGRRATKPTERINDLDPV
ncbi:hypothetical protein D5S18_25850 [Nocardia panacis]|uniref:Membrane-anchored protein n=1 Tax=Nocardia panacis TaxID=2340916 RepID=A0A3A4KN84_9NOCA|nr:hypothetical protein [Nocardia panacis]RJO71006.1 hypothetical protein D5S18_25850 [Nocardia panacis]